MYSTVNFQEVNKTDFYDFLRRESNSSKDLAAKNMWHDDYKNKNYTLPYILEKTDRFTKNGIFNVIFYNNQIIGCGGAYISDFCSDFLLAGVRTWISIEYRNKSLIKDNLLPFHKRFAVDNCISAIGLSFNDYNKNIITIFKRARLGENKDRLKRDSKHLFYNELIELNYPVRIQNTKQYLIYERLDNSFSFDFNSIKFN